jgi:hypothetical protein
VFGLRAVGNPKLGYFVYQLGPGGTTQGAVIVSNVGTASGVVKLFTADGTTGATSGTVYKTDTAPSATGGWVTLGATSFTLAPGGHRQVPFTVRVPSGTKPGQWVGGIVAETSTKVAEQKSGQKARVQIKVRDLTIVAVQVNVPGTPHISFTIGKITTGGSGGFQKVFVHFANDGNLLVKPRGTVTISNSEGAVVESLPFTMDTFLPATSIDYPILLKKALTAGSYTAKVVLMAPGVSGAATRTFTANPAFSVSSSDVKQVFTSAQPTKAPPGGASGSSSSGLPTWAYGAIGAGVLVVLLLLLLLLMRRRGDREPAAGTTLQRPAEVVTAPPPPPAPATLPTPAAIPEPAPEAPAPPPPTPAAATPGGTCDHTWDVAYDRGQLGTDGVWRFPHRCRSCGVELLARDVADATAQANAARTQS